MMEMSERLKGLKKLRNGILLPDAEADLPPAFDHCTLSTAIMQNRVCTPFFTPFSDLTSKSECCGTPFLSNNNRVLTPFFTPFF